VQEIRKVFVVFELIDQPLHPEFRVLLQDGSDELIGV
jgi:hypothetical protein